MIVPNLLYTGRSDGVPTAQPHVRFSRNGLKLLNRVTKGLRNPIGVFRQSIRERRQMRANDCKQEVSVPDFAIAL